MPLNMKVKFYTIEIPLKGLKYLDKKKKPLSSLLYLDLVVHDHHRSIYLYH